MFLLGIWKDFCELETNLSLPELTTILESVRERDNREREFMASVQGVELGSTQVNAKQAFEDLKARVFSGGAAKDSSDIMSLQGITAAQSGFGIGMGIDYQNADESFQWSQL